MRVIKFGGTSLGSSESLKTALGIIEKAAAEGPTVVVTSAVTGVTDLLVEFVEAPIGDQHELLERTAGEIEHRHLQLHESVEPASFAFGGSLRELVDELRAWSPGQAGATDWTSEARDHVLSLGDRAASLLVASLLRQAGLHPTTLRGGEVIQTDSAFGPVRIDRQATRNRVRWAVGQSPRGSIPVVAGFSGADRDGRTTILGRGSSDLTASILGEALSADAVEIWSDVDGVYEQDPRLDPEATVLPLLSYAQARALARAGAKVLHPDCLDPVERSGIPLRVRNTFRPDAVGTTIEQVGPARAIGRPTGAEPEGSGKTVRLILAGATGGVGSAFLRQLRRVAPDLRSQGVEVKVSGAFSSQAHLWDREGLCLDVVEGSTLTGPRPDWPDVARRLAEAPPENPLFVDCTASHEVAARYPDILSAGAPLVTPNKLALSGSLEHYRRTRDAAGREGIPYRYETTVGAALPILKTIRELRTGGDRFRTIAGVLSGTLSFLFSRLADGVPFSKAVREAREAGFTEPHPRDDLTGADVARKLLILLREAGHEIEPQEIPVESLVPEALATEEDPDRFLDGLAGFDDAWDRRFAEAGGQPLAYVAWFDGVEAGVGVRTLTVDHPLAGLRATENRVVLETDRYPDVPLTIAGPGAGWEVTASGVLADFLSALHERYGSRRVA